MDWILALVFAALAPAPARDLARCPLDPEPHQAAPVARPGTVDETAAVAALLERQDRLVLARQRELAAADFAPDFRARDLDVESPAALLERLDRFVDSHRDLALATEVVRLTCVGDCLVADVVRKINGIRRADEAAIREEVHETAVLRRSGEQLRIRSFHDRAVEFDGRLDRAARRYEVGDLCFGVKLPQPFVPIPRRAPGAALDRLLLLDPVNDVELELMVFDPTIDAPLDEALLSDLVRPGSTVLLEPTRFEKAPPAFPQAFVAELEYEETVAAAPRQLRERAIYLSPDRRITFAAWITASADRFDAVKGGVDELVRSLRLTDIKPGRPYHEGLIDANPRWRTLTDGIFRPAAAPIDLVIPAGLAATPLLGDHVIRLRLSLIEDLRSTIVVRVFPQGEKRVAASKLLESSVQRMTEFACAEGVGGDSRRLSGVRQVLGQHGDWNGVEILCADGTRRTWQIVAVDRGGAHVQVQLMPGSAKIELQSAALTKVLDGLRIREP
ncbi:MAG: hypothetical protein FJ293_01835 [Planctomycetes bacterium]|nr:hypothetical protein [Planctomycetota bacterium]